MSHKAGEGSKIDRKSRFSTWWPWPLTYDLDHRTCLRFYQGQPLWCQYVKWFGRESANELTDRRKDTQKHGTDSITSTADAGGSRGNKLVQNIWDGLSFSQIRIICSDSPQLHYTSLQLIIINTFIKSVSNTYAPVWILLCLVSSDGVWHFLPHVEQIWVDSPGCFSVLCCNIVLRRSNISLQNGHLYNLLWTDMFRLCSFVICSL